MKRVEIYIQEILFIFLIKLHDTKIELCFYYFELIILRLFYAIIFIFVAIYCKLNTMF